MNEKLIKEYRRKRDERFIEFVMNDNDKPIKKLAREYLIYLPKSKKAFRGGIYKRVQECANIPDDVKDVAFMKCLKLGMTPFLPGHHFKTGGTK